MARLLIALACLLGFMPSSAGQDKAPPAAPPAIKAQVLRIAGKVTVTLPPASKEAATETRDLHEREELPEGARVTAAEGGFARFLVLPSGQLHVLLESETWVVSQDRKSVV